MCALESFHCRFGQPPKFACVSPCRKKSFLDEKILELSHIFTATAEP
jgi:hypothetical protein